MRATLDKLISWTGLLVAVLLLVAGGLLTWAYFFIGNEVDHQLTAQDITMPEGEALESLPDDDREALEPYAGEQMTTGPQAKAYADHYIGAHLDAASDGRSYAEVSSEQMAACAADKASADCAELTALKETMFQGNTLRGLLLYGYAFATIGTIAGYGAIAAFIGAVVMILLGLLGLRHARMAAKTEPDV